MGLNEAKRRKKVKKAIQRNEIESRLKLSLLFSSVLSVPSLGGSPTVGFAELLVTIDSKDFRRRMIPFFSFYLEKDAVWLGAERKKEAMS